MTTPGNVPRINWPTDRIERRLDTLERLLATANSKELPTLNHCINLLLTELVLREEEDYLNCFAAMQKQKQGPQR